MMQNHIVSTIEHRWFENAITILIAINFLTLSLGTEGYELAGVELIILGIFTAEMLLKMYGYGVRMWWKNGWNRFDAFVVVVGIILEVNVVELPEALGALRALRIVRLFGRIPSTRALIEAIGASARQLGGVALLSTLFLMLFTLMATMSFQSTLPEAFGSMQTSLTTLLAIATFNQLEVIGEAWEVSPVGTLLIFPGYVFAVPLMTLNLIIAVLSRAVSESGAQKSVTEEELMVQMQKLERMMKEFNSARRA